MIGKYVIVDEDAPDAVRPEPIEGWSQVLAGMCTYQGAVRLELAEHPAAIAATFEERADQQWFLDNHEVPAAVFATADGRALIDVSSFWGRPAVRVFSQVDQTLVQTMLRRSWRPKTRNPAAQLDSIEGEQTRFHAPGRSVRVASGPAEALLKAHQAHVEAHGEAVALHGCEDFLRLARQALGHSVAVIEARNRAAIRLQGGSAMLLGSAGFAAGLGVGQPMLAAALGTAGVLAPWMTTLPIRLAHRWVASHPVPLRLR